MFPKLADGVTRDIIFSHNHVDTWKLMEKLPATGKTKAIGVSNYSVPNLEKLLAEASIVPATNQIENHPSLAQQEVVDFCKAKGILIEAYSPLGSTGSPLFTAEPVVEIAKKRGVTPAVVLLSWHCAFPFSLFLVIPDIDYFDSGPWLRRPRQVHQPRSHHGEQGAG